LIVALENLLDLAKSLDDAQRFNDAEQDYRIALALQRQALGTTHPEVALTMTTLARVLRESGDPDRLKEVEPILREAISILRAAGDDDKLSRVLHELGYVLKNDEDRESAFRESLTLHRRSFGPDTTYYI